MTESELDGGARWGSGPTGTEPALSEGGKRGELPAAVGEGARGSRGASGLSAELLPDTVQS